MKSLLIILALVSSSVFAAASGKSMGVKMFNNMEKVEKLCPGLEITKKQKISIVKAIAELRTAAKPLRKDMKIARKAKRKIMMNPTTTKEEAITASKEVQKTRKPLRKLRRATMLEIQFDILSGEQRVKILKCMTKPRRS